MKRCTKATLWVVGVMTLGNAIFNRPQPLQTTLTAEEEAIGSCSFYSDDRVYEYQGETFRLNAFPVSVERGSHFILRIPKLSYAASGEALMLYFPGAPTWNMVLKQNSASVEFVAGVLHDSQQLTETAAEFAGPTALRSCRPAQERLKLLNLA